MSLALGYFVATRISPTALRVLCANNTESCLALAHGYEAHSGNEVKLVRLPTTKALEKLAASAARPEFDVFIGGPSESYEQARAQGLIRPHQLPQSAHNHFSTDYWIGTYGGILAFCLDPANPFHISEPRRWSDLTAPQYHKKIVLPSPLTSGTAATMLHTLAQFTENRHELRDYLQKLHHNTLTYTDSGTNLVNLIADGKAAVAVTFAPYCGKIAGREMKIIYPADGTGYEIGAAAAVQGGDFTKAQDFLRFASSDAAQALVASIEQQNPISPRLPNNLAHSLAQLQVPVADARTFAQKWRRADLINFFAREVLYD